ncbi:unnamed protein product (macronuclear) [Paramecium tetraurelia]|uniref:Transmembrane protein n=1 Tax=Paramecium tetraurelia TaxID=5888 RepID=A0CKY2_PARTE|nr:uncharacterized protein GSPATT00007996001 [Paramecium tetraurelia]CAK71449.1 unnamed protein product [Paramecium tetraurelia]|eukprot:XP_001438846.1 hypothetical protein (macronuclear) [Paramecium tetraurelia strain d4-2]
MHTRSTEQIINLKSKLLRTMDIKQLQQKTILCELQKSSSLCNTQKALEFKKQLNNYYQQQGKNQKIKLFLMKFLDTLQLAFIVFVSKQYYIQIKRNQIDQIFFSRHLQNIKDTIYKQLIENDNKFKNQRLQIHCKFLLKKQLIYKDLFRIQSIDQNQQIINNRILEIQFRVLLILFGLKWKTIKKIIRNSIIEFNHILAQNIDATNLSNKINKQQQTEISLFSNYIIILASLISII